MVACGPIEGHIDGLLKHRRGCQDHKGDRLLEVKTMNRLGFERFVRERTPGYEYLCQINGYMRGLGVEEAQVLAKNKDTAELYTQTLQYDPVLVDKRLEKLSDVFQSKAPEDVHREYGPGDDAGILPWQCGYCPFVERCWTGRLQKTADFRYRVTKVLHPELPTVVTEAKVEPQAGTPIATGGEGNREGALPV